MKTVIFYGMLGDEKLLNETRKQAFLEMERKYPDGKILKFISDEKTDLQVGITLNTIKKRICIKNNKK